MHYQSGLGVFSALAAAVVLMCGQPRALRAADDAPAPRERISIDSGWRFAKGDPSDVDSARLMYDVRPAAGGKAESNGAATTQDTEKSNAVATLKAWILPTGDAFIADPKKRHVRPAGDPGGDVSCVQADFDDKGWEQVTLPHDWAITGPFNTGWKGVGGGMGRLPSPGIGWYRRKLRLTPGDAGKSIFLDVDGAMSYATVWLNGHLVGGWPYGYASWRLDLTPYVSFSGENQLAIRLDNPAESSRWYPGGGIYRNVWLTKVDPVHVGHWGTYVTTPQVSAAAATVALAVTVDNDSTFAAAVTVSTEIYALDSEGRQIGDAVATIESGEVSLAARSSVVVRGSATVEHPALWGPPPQQKPNRYVAVSTIRQGDRVVDRYETRFGIRDIRFDPDCGLLVNGEHITIYGVNQHHDLGPLGAAFNVRAAEHQLQLLREMGCNAIRMSHNPPAPELLELTDRMGFLVMDEIFDCWYGKKNPNDFI